MVYGANSRRGELTPIGQTVEVLAPACVDFVKARVGTEN